MRKPAGRRLVPSRYEKDCDSYKEYKDPRRLGRIMFSRVTTFCALFAITTYATAQTETLPPGMHEVIRGLDSAASEALRNPNEVGYTLGVVARNGLVWTKSYGFADKGRSRPAGAETEYGIGTGAFTAIMLLQLMRDGKAHLSDNLRVRKKILGAGPKKAVVNQGMGAKRISPKRHVHQIFMQGPLEETRIHEETEESCCLADEDGH